MTPFWTACAVAFLLPVVTPRGKLFRWSSFIIGGLIAVVWAQHLYVTSRLEYTASVGSSLGQALMVCITAVWFLGLAVRYIFWLFQLKREEILEKRQRNSCRQSTQQSVQLDRTRKLTLQVNGSLRERDNEE